MQISTPMSDALERYLDLSSLELKLTAQNMANIDTPGYRAQGFDFAGEMERSLGELTAGQTKNGVARKPFAPGAARVGLVDGLIERPDGIAPKEPEPDHTLISAGIEHFFPGVPITWSGDELFIAIDGRRACVEVLELLLVGVYTQSLRLVLPCVGAWDGAGRWNGLGEGCRSRCNG